MPTIRRSESQSEDDAGSPSSFAIAVHHRRFFLTQNDAFCGICTLPREEEDAAAIDTTSGSARCSSAICWREALDEQPRADHPVHAISTVIHFSSAGSTPAAAGTPRRGTSSDGHDIAGKTRGCRWSLLERFRVLKTHRRSGYGRWSRVRRKAQGTARSAMLQHLRRGVKHGGGSSRRSCRGCSGHDVAVVKDGAHWRSRASGVSNLTIGVVGSAHGSGSTPSALEEAARAGEALL